MGLEVGVESQGSEWGNCEVHWLDTGNHFTTPSLVPPLGPQMVNQLQCPIIRLQCPAWRQWASGLLRSSDGFEILAVFFMDADCSILQSCELNQQMSECLVLTVGH